ncbi:MAG: YSC84-related protein [Pseudomonadota bacterium]|nr:YSC84-related protein [Pseudomonadota bacterium]
MKHLRIAALLCIFLLFAALAFAAKPDSYATATKRFQESAEARNYFNHAYGYALFPNIGKGGIAIGGAFGQGRVYHGGKLSGTATLTQLTIGFQLGGQAYSEIIFFEDERAYEEFTSGAFSLNAKASAVAITTGAQAQTGTSGQTVGVSSGPANGKQQGSNYVSGMAIFVHARGGLMYEASIGGQKFTFERL